MILDISIQPYPSSFIHMISLIGNDCSFNEIKFIKL